MALGTSTPDLDHGGGHEHVDLAPPELLHQGAPFGYRQLAVDTADAVVGKLAGTQLERLALGGGGLEVLGFADQRADDVGLAALAQEPPHAGEHLRAVAPAARAG